MKRVKFTLSYCEIECWYKVDTFNQRLIVGFVNPKKVNLGLYFGYLKDATMEAYDHYNAINKDNEFIYPGSIVEAI